MNEFNAVLAIDLAAMTRQTVVSSGRLRQQVAEDELDLQAHAGRSRGTLSAEVVREGLEHLQTLLQRTEVISARANQDCREGSQR